MGLFEKYGLKLDLGPKLGGGGPARVQAVVTDNTEVATSDIISVLGGIYSGAKIKILMVMTPYGDEEVWGHEQVQDAQGRRGPDLGRRQPRRRPTLQCADDGRRHGLQVRRVPMGRHIRRRRGAPGGIGYRPHAADQPVASRCGDWPKPRASPSKSTSSCCTPRSTPRRSRGLSWWRRRAGSRTHQDVATRYVEMMLDANRQWQNNASSWVDAAAKIYQGSGLDDQQLHAAWQLFHDGGYFSVNGGINFAATQKIMDLFFKLRSESPNNTLVEAGRHLRHRPAQGGARQDGRRQGHARSAGRSGLVRRQGRSREIEWPGEPADRPHASAGSRPHSCASLNSSTSARAIKARRGEDSAGARRFQPQGRRRALRLAWSGRAVAARPRCCGWRPDSLLRTAAKFGSTAVQLTRPSPKMSMVFQAIGLMPWKTRRGQRGAGHCSCRPIAASSRDDRDRAWSAPRWPWSG